MQHAAAGLLLACLGAQVPCEVRLHDHSVLRCELLQEEFVVATSYGTLKVPAKELRLVHFGLHYPEGMEEEVRRLIGLLGAKEFKVREQAYRDLVRRGRYAWAPCRAAKSEDLEVARLLDKVLEELRESLPKEQQAEEIRDRVEAEYAALGRLQGNGLRVRSASLGEYTLKLEHLASLRVLEYGKASTLRLDAANFGVGDDAWFDTGITLLKGDPRTVTVSGVIDLYPSTPGTYTTGPLGYENLNAGKYGKPGAVVGRVGIGGEVFAVGEQVALRDRGEGRLYLAVASSTWNVKYQGEYRVVIK